MNLFPLKQELADTNEQLALLQKKYSQFDYVYLNVHMRKDWVSVKLFLDEEWVFFERFADKNFVKELQKSFNSRVWELYLFHFLRHAGFKFEFQSKNHPNPDFKVKNGNKKIFIEAVTPSKGTGVNKVETLTDLLGQVPSGTMVSRGGKIDDFNHPKVRRILNVLDVKVEQYHNNHKQLLSGNDYYVIAVNGANIEGSMSGDDLILEAVLGIDPAIRLPLMPDGSLGVGYKVLRSQIQNSKASSPIDLGVFNQDSFKEISGVIYFGSDVINGILQNCEKDIVFVHNPNVIPSRKLDLDVFSCFKQIVRTQNGFDVIPQKAS
jgi:hypothetical protein